MLFHIQGALAFYIYSSVLLIFNLEGPKLKDKYQMLTHHAITMFLVWFSWYQKLHVLGCIVMILHDVSDPFMELAKMSLYAGRQNQANAMFALFAVVFLISRWVVYPMWILYPCFSFALSEYGSGKARYLFPNYWIGLLMMLSLQILHIIWGALIVKMIVEALTKGNVQDDIRDDNGVDGGTKSE